MNSIVKTFFGCHLDLDKVIAISDVEVGTLGSVYFTIAVSSRSAPICYNEQAGQDIDQARRNLQIKVDQLVYQWKHWTKHKQIEDRRALVVKNNLVENQYPEEDFK